MSIEELKEQLHKAIEETEDEALLLNMYTAMKLWNEDEWDKLPDSVKETIALSLQKVEAGRVIPHQEVFKRIPHLTTLSADQADWPDDQLPHSLLSPEDEKNVRRIWKSPGGC